VGRVKVRSFTAVPSRLCHHGCAITLVTHLGPW
jgi:hypothetical protein